MQGYAGGERFPAIGCGDAQADLSSLGDRPQRLRPFAPQPHRAECRGLDPTALPARVMRVGGADPAIEDRPGAPGHGGPLHPHVEAARPAGRAHGLLDGFEHGRAQIAKAVDAGRTLRVRERREGSWAWIIRTTSNPMTSPS